jgi:hypothetical protein
VAVLADTYSVIVRVPTLTADYPGGVEAYKANCPNRTFCSDGEVCRIGFMSWADAEAFLESLHRFNITREADAVAVIREDKGLLHACEWLEFHHIEGEPIARLVDSTVESFAAPPGWVPGARPGLTTEAELLKWELVEEKNGVASYRNPSTGEMRYVGRALVQCPRKPWWKFWS